MTHKYIEENKDIFLNELFEFIKIQSVSADMSFKDEVLKAAVFLENNLKEIGADNVRLFPTDGHPIVYGEKIIRNDLPTILVYIMMFNQLILMSSGIQIHNQLLKIQIFTPENLLLEELVMIKQMFIHLKAFEVCIARRVKL